MSALSAEIANLKETIDSLSGNIIGENQKLEEKKGHLSELEKELEELKY